MLSKRTLTQYLAVSIDGVHFVQHIHSQNPRSSRKMTTLLPDSLELSKPVSILHWKENKNVWQYSGKSSVKIRLRQKAELLKSDQFGIFFG